MIFKDGLWYILYHWKKSLRGTKGFDVVKLPREMNWAYTIFRVAKFSYYNTIDNRAVFTWLSKGIGFGFGLSFTTPFGWLVYSLWFWFYDSQVKTALYPWIEYTHCAWTGSWTPPPIPSIGFYHVCTVQCFCFVYTMDIKWDQKQRWKQVTIDPLI